MVFLTLVVLATISGLLGGGAVYDILSGPKNHFDAALLVGGTIGVFGLFLIALAEYIIYRLRP